MKEEVPGVMACMLCGQMGEIFAAAPQRKFYRCLRCELIFVAPEDYLSLQEERSRYASHENSFEDGDYRKFLQPFMNALKERISREAKGLDFGSGKAKPLETWLGEESYALVSYDSYFFPDPSLLKRRYEFICLTEVLEHLHHPLKELCQLQQLLKPGGLLGVQTRWIPQTGPWQAQGFPQWHYARDPTHVAFYSPRSLSWIAQYFQWKLELLSDDLAFFYKRDSKCQDII